MKSLKNLATLVLSNSIAGAGLGVLEQLFHKHFPETNYYMNKECQTYTYWVLFWGSFVVLNHILTRKEKNGLERAIDIGANTLYGWTAQDAAYWMTKYNTLDVLGKVNLDWMPQYFPIIGDIAATKVIGVPLAYLASLGAYGAYLVRNIFKLKKKEK